MENKSRDVQFSQAEKEFTNQLKEFLSAYRMQIGGSYIFTIEDIMFRPDWLVGVFVSGVRIFHLKDWLKIEFLLEGEWEKFYEGSCKDINQFKFIYTELLNIDID